MKNVLLFVVTLIICGGLLTAQSKTAPIAIAIEAVQKNPIKLGVEIRVSITVTNTSKENVVLLTTPGPGGRHAGLWYDVVVRNTNGSSVTKTRFKRILDREDQKGHVFGSSIATTLAPGESVKEEATLGDMYELTIPGTYLVRVDRPFPDANPASKIKSNQISITLER